MGFGFTIADSVYGQKVKKILDRMRCKNLMEGDILVDINSINVKRMSHSDVVQVLKECAEGQEAIVMVERGGMNSPSKGRPRKEPLPSPKKAVIGPSSASPAFSTYQYRSKTPTADMYSSQTKEVMPNRPKTPLVDTRNRPKTPNVMGIQEMLSVDQRVPNPGAGANNSHPYNPNNPQMLTNHQDLQYDPKMMGISQQMSRVAIDSNNYGYFNNDTSRGSNGEFNNYPSNNGPVPTSSHPNYNYPNNTSFPPDSGYRPQNSSGSYEYDINRGAFNYPSNYPSNQAFNFYPNNNSSPSNGAIPSNPNSINNNGHNTSLDNPGVGGYGYMYPKEGFDNTRQDSGYSSQTQIPPVQYPSYPGESYSNPTAIPPNVYSYPNSSLRGKKVSTSFEHEHPAPVSMPR